MRRRVVICDELCTTLVTLYHAARALSASGIGVSEAEIAAYLKKAPASVHTICALIRDFAAAFNPVIDLTEPDTSLADDPIPGSADSPVAPVVRKALFKALDEHTRLRSWQDVQWVGFACDSQHRLEFSWSAAMDTLQKNPQRGYPGIRPIVLLSRRIGDEALALFDPLTGPIAEERGLAFSATKKIRAQVEHIRALVNRKCDALEVEMRSVQSAIIKAQSQTMSLVKNLASIGRNPPPPSQQ